MFATYTTVGYDTRAALGNTTTYAAAVLADWVGLLTGTITATSQLSAYADKASCAITGAAGDWTVYDADAHYSYSGIGKVLRRPNAGGVGYQYMWIGFRCPSADGLNGFISFMGGWNSTTKAPTTVASSSAGSTGSAVIAAGTVFNSTTLALAYGASLSGSAGTYLFNSGASAAYAPAVYNLLSAPGVCAAWPQAMTGGATALPYALLAEHDDVHPYSNAAAGCAPLIYASGNTTGHHVAIAPQVKNNAGDIVNVGYTLLSTVFYADNWEAASSSSYSYTPSARIFDYVRSAAGVKSIPVVPIDVRLRTTATVTAPTYVGRLRSVFATLAALYAGDTFTVGTDTYVVIPAYGYSTSVTGYSSAGKLCAKVQ